jgi:tetratricopeptide (TPR) repeat protein
MGRKSLKAKLNTTAGRAIVLAVVAVAAIALYLPAARYGFVWDDEPLITNNSLLAHSRPADVFSRGFWAGSPEQLAGPSASYYRPLVTLSLWLDLHVSHANPVWFHLFNTLLYALAAVAVTMVLWELLHSGVWALLGGLLFVAHSSHVESVAFISGRTDVMLTLFVGIAGFALLRSLGRHNRWWWLAVLPAFALALLSKETAVLFPLLVVLAPLLLGVKYDRRYWLLVMATLAVLAGYFLLRAAVVPQVMPIDTRTNFLVRLAAAVDALGVYTRMFFWPFAHHVWYQAGSAAPLQVANVLAVLFIAVTAVLFALRSRYVPVLWGYAWAFAFILPALTGAAIGAAAAERLLLLPSAGIVMALMVWLSRLSRGASKAVQAGLAVVVVALGADTMMRSRVWRNSETLFTAMVHEAPTASNGYAALADALIKQRPDSALALYDHALRLNPADAHAHLSAALLLARRGDQPGAIRHLRAARDLTPGSETILNNLALAFGDAGELDSAVATFDRAIAAHPTAAALYLNRASVLKPAGRTAEAWADLHRALALDSTVPWAANELATMYGQRGQYDSAIVLMRHEVRYHPSAENLDQLGGLLTAAGDSLRAGQTYRQALTVDPAYVPALYHLALLAAAQRDTAMARTLAARAYQLRPDIDELKTLCSQLALPRQP